VVKYEDMEKAIMCQVAGKLLDSLPEEKKKEILEASLTKTLQDVFQPWNVERAIRYDANRYMAEYIKDPAVQERIKKATRDSFDKLMDGVIYAIIIESQNSIKSEYRKFVDPPEKKK
jgi:hypothetical protein